MNKLPFGKKNYRLMIIGVVVILAGFLIMSLDSEEFGFGALGLTIGPLVVFTGFIIEFFAILARPGETRPDVSRSNVARPDMARPQQPS